VAVINISLPIELLEKVDYYKTIIKKNRSEFFADAVNAYFNQVEEYINYENRKKSIKRLIKLGGKLYEEKVFDVEINVVEEIRKSRQDRTNELLKRV